MTDSEIPSDYLPYPPPQYSEFTSMEDQLSPLYVKWSYDEPASMGLRVDKQHMNGLGICHGATLMLMMDFALASAICFATGRMAGSPTINIDLDYMQPGNKGDWIYTRAHCLKTTNTMGFAEGGVYSEAGLLVKAKGIFKLPKDKSSGIEYKAMMDSILSPQNANS